MTTTQNPETTTSRPTVGSAVLIGIVAVAALIGIAVGINVAYRAATTTANSSVTVPVVVTADAPQPTGPGIGPGDPGWPAPVDLPLVHSGHLMLGIVDADPLTAVLSQAETWVSLLTAGGVVLLLIPVLRATTAGRPFAPANARRLTIAAVAATAGWTLAATLPVVAAQRAISGEMAGVPAQWYAPLFQPEWWPLGFAAFLAVLAAATAHGARLGSETEGLV